MLNQVQQHMPKRDFRQRFSKSVHKRSGSRTQTLRRWYPAVTQPESTRSSATLRSRGLKNGDEVLSQIPFIFFVQRPDNPRSRYPIILADPQGVRSSRRYCPERMSAWKKLSRNTRSKDLYATFGQELHVCSLFLRVPHPKPEYRSYTLHHHHILASSSQNRLLVHSSIVAVSKLRSG